MPWWAIVLAVLVLYLIWKVYKIIQWLHKLFDSLNQKILQCCDQTSPDPWPPEGPPPFP